MRLFLSSLNPCTYCHAFQCKRNETAYDNVGMKLILDVLAVV